MSLACVARVQSERAESHRGVGVRGGAGVGGWVVERVGCGWEWLVSGVVVYRRGGRAVRGVKRAEGPKERESGVRWGW